MHARMTGGGGEEICTRAKSLTREREWRGKRGDTVSYIGQRAVAREINKFLSFHPCYIYIYTYIYFEPNSLDDPSTPAVESKTRGDAIERKENSFEKSNNCV